jgi:hypothetical protein
VQWPSEAQARACEAAPWGPPVGAIRREHCVARWDTAQVKVSLFSFFFFFILFFYFYFYFLYSNNLGFFALSNQSICTIKKSSMMHSLVLFIYCLVLFIKQMLSNVEFIYTQKILSKKEHFLI